jgi:hypothetical protein
MFRSLLYGHPQGSSFVLSALQLLRLFASSSCLFGMWLYVVYVCVCARCTCLWDVWSADALYRLFYYSKSALHVSGNVFAHHQEHLTVFTVSGSVYRGIALPFLDHGTRRGWGVSVTLRPLFTSGKDPVPIVQEAGWVPGSVWRGTENLAHHWDSIPRPSSP